MRTAENKTKGDESGAAPPTTTRFTELDEAVGEILQKYEDGEIGKQEVARLTIAVVRIQLGTAMYTIDSKKES